MLSLHFNQQSLALSSPKIMGILNCTPNSFSDGGDFFSINKAIEKAFQMVDEGADIIDIGAESTNPKAQPISADEEIARLTPIIRALVGKINVPISVDTFRSQTIKAMLREGVDIINDVTGLGDPNTLSLIQKSQAALIIMHMLGSPKQMHVEAHYPEGITASIKHHLLSRVKRCVEAGIRQERLILDPGFGFDKSYSDQLILLRELATLTQQGLPLLVGMSRKRLIGEITQVTTPKLRLAGNISAALWAMEQGAHIVRVHDVKATKEALLMWQAIKESTTKKTIL